MKALLSVAALVFIVATMSEHTQAPEAHELVIVINGQVFNPEPKVENIELPPPVEPVAVDPSELNCMALNIYHEARGESEVGRLAVANVTMNRVNHRRYPDTICGVVQQGIHYTNWKGNRMPKRHKCQFSWYCDGKADTVFENRAWANSLDLALEVMMGMHSDITKGATHYYNPHKADPSWAQQYAMTAQHGNHVFMSMVY